MKYDWEKNSESWLKGMHARKRSLRLNVGVSLLLVFIYLSFLGLTTFISELWPISDKTMIHYLFLFSAGMFLLSAVMIIFQLRRDRIVIERIPPYKARVCPKCRATFDQMSVPNLDKNPPLTVQCPSCSRSFVLSEVEDYWAIYPSLMKDVFPSWRRNLDWFSYQGKYDPKQPLAFAFYLRPRTLVFITILILAGYPLLVSVLGTGSVLVGMAEHSYVLFILPCSIFMYAIVRRKGRSVHCRKCQYEKAPGTGDRCSECGADWSWPFQCRRGIKKSSLRHKCIAAVLLLAMIISPFLLLRIGSGAMVMRVLPTASLITQITKDRRGYLCRDEWDLLNQRILSPDETRTLFLDLLDKHHDQGWIIPPARFWFNTQLKNGTIPRNLLDRYFRESLHIHSLTPTTAAPGETIHLTLSVQLITINNYLVDNRILLERIEINGQPVPDSRLDRVIMPYQFIKGRVPDKLKLRALPTPLTLPDQPGPVSIKLIYWQAITPKRGIITPGANKYDPPRIRHTKPSDIFITIEWNDDDTPILPPDIIWANRVEQEFTITVK